MWKTLSTSQRALLRLINSQKFKRSFLSEAYRCTDAWNARLQSPLLSKINSNELFVELDQKFQVVGRTSAVDVDIYTNIITDDDHADELADILHNFRLSAETSNTLDSTHHATIRYLLDNHAIDDLMMILNDRINYGIFPDHLCYNILMDTFLNKKDFANAAKIAVLLMLQEDYEHPISNSLALYSCHKYLENPDDWKSPETEPEDKGEEMKVRVRYIRNPYFDDHFDLREPSKLVGKTLTGHGKSINDTLGRSCHLRGLVLWKKYQEAADLIKEFMKTEPKDCIYSETLSQIQEYLSSIPEDKVNDEIKELKTLLEGLSKIGLKEGSVIKEIENRVKAAVEKQADTDIADQCQKYEEWEKTRIDIMRRQLDELDKKKRLEKVEETKKDLFERERFITYFENEEKIELQIDEKLLHEKLVYGKRVRTIEDLEDNYVPPEITSKPK